MKKAYVKPVFFAEEYVMTACVANCEFHADREAAHIWEGLHMCAGTPDKDGNYDPNYTDGHLIGGQNKNKGLINEFKVGNTTTGLWGYATNGGDTDDGLPAEGATLSDQAYLFAGQNTTCDFIWNAKSDPVYVWVSDKNNPTTSLISNSANRNPLTSFLHNIGSFAAVFFGNDSNYENHSPAYQGEILFS